MSDTGAAPVDYRKPSLSAQIGSPAFSIVVPTCDRPGLLARALFSVVAQTFDDWECVVVNDVPAARLSVDALLLKIGDSRIWAWHNDVNQGVAAARNAGIARTSGHYLAFLDDDDYWLPEHLRGIFHAHAASPDPVLVYTDFIQEWEAEIVAPRLTMAKSPPEDPTRGFLQGTYNILTMSTVSIPRSCINDVGMFDPSLKTGQDWDFYLRVSERYGFFHLHQHSVVYYNHFNQRLTSDYRTRLSSLSVVVSKWNLDATFVHNKTKLWKYMALDDMIYAAYKRDIAGKYRALTYFLSFPEPFTSIALLVKLLLVAILPFSVYSFIVRTWNRRREEAARKLLDAFNPANPRAPQLSGRPGGFRRAGGRWS